MNLVDSFVEYLSFERGYSVRTVEEYKSDLMAFESFFKELDDELSWNTLDSDVVRQWVVVMMERGNKPTSVNRRLSAVRSFYKYLQKSGRLEVNPAGDVRGPKKDARLPAFLKEEEMERLFSGDFFSLDFEGCRNKLILLMFYATGVRLSELLALKWVDVDMSAGLLRVIGKGNKQRMIPIGDGLKEALLLYKKERGSLLGDFSSGRVFVECDGVAMKSGKVSRIVRDSLSWVTSQQKRSPHVLRHTFATALLNHQAKLDAVKDLLGHNSLSTTEIYTHMTFEELRQVYNQTHPRV